jgi:hypothetical protein
VRSPGGFKVGNKQKATFVQENQVRAKLRSLFLYAASGSVANAQSRARRADTSGARVSDNSTPSRATDATGRWGGSAEEIPARLPWRHALRSTIRSGTPPLAPHAATSGPSVPSAQPKDKKAARKWGGQVSQGARIADRFGATAKLTFALLLPFGQLWPPFCLVASGGWLAAAVVPIALLFPGVSCPQV